MIKDKSVKAGERTQHTPGPWNAETKSVHVVSKYGLCECDVDSKDLLICCARGTNKEEAIDNARLIAAAPELLETLKSVQTALRLSEQAPKLLAEVEAAIAKAEVK